MPKNLAQKHRFVLAKLLKFQETFLEKFLVSGFGAEAPTFNAHKKHGIAVLFIFSSLYVGTAIPNLRFKRLFEKSPLKIRKNFLNGLYVLEKIQFALSAISSSSISAVSAINFTQGRIL